LLTVDAEGDPPAETAIEQAATALREGQVVAVPTDTVYGLAVDPQLPVAVARLFALKERPTSVALPVLVAGWDQVESLAGPLEVAASRLAGRHWPGPLTLVVPRTPSFIADLGGPPSARHTVGLRWPDHPVTATLCRALGPLAVTSANRHGAPPASTASEVGEQFRDARGAGGGGSAASGLSLVLDGGRCAGSPSTVVECRGGSVRCLRDGALPFAALAAEVDGEGPDRAAGEGGGPAGAG
jgi:L-threonylcarbamoyladenylate synthase